MGESDTVAAARLELLSTTAILKNDLEKPTTHHASSGHKHHGDRPEVREPSGYIGLMRTTPVKNFPETSTTPQPATISASPSASSSPGDHNKGHPEILSPHPVPPETVARDIATLMHERSAAFSPQKTEHSPYHYQKFPRDEREGQDPSVARYPPGMMGYSFSHQPEGYPHPLPHPPVGPSRQEMWAGNENVPPPGYYGMYQGPLLPSDGLMDHRGRPVTGGLTPHAGSAQQHEAMYFPPPAQGTATPDDREGSGSRPISHAGRKPSYEQLVHENYRMREQLREKERSSSQLYLRITYLEKQISELRQLPTGKISHIPIEDMVRIMEEYGSEVSNQTLPKRKDSIKKASIVRQFRRWNPEFFRYFSFSQVNGGWAPKLGKEGEIKRRIEKRRMLKDERQTIYESSK